MAPCWGLCPQEGESAGRGVCEESRVLMGKWVDVTSQVALRWKAPHWVVKAVLAELGSDPTLAEIKETKLPNA